MVPRSPSVEQARVRYQLAVSLDGFIGPPDGSTDWLEDYGSVAIEALSPFLQQIGVGIGSKGPGPKPRSR